MKILLHAQKRFPIVTEWATLIFAISQLSHARGFYFVKARSKKGGGEANKNELCQSTTIKTPVKL